MLLPTIAASLTLCSLPLVAVAEDTTRPPDARDLNLFITRPDLRPPKFDIEVYQPDRVSPGYWFVAPYSTLAGTYYASLYQLGQEGPHIYDGDGNLVWSGAHLFSQGRATFDFKAIDINGTQHLSVMGLASKRSKYHPEGVGLILDPSFTVIREVNSQVGGGVENMHEFNIVNGKQALMLTHQTHVSSVNLAGSNLTEYLSIGNSGFVEVDVDTGDISFEWWSLDRIHTNETYENVPIGAEHEWDWLHLNSVDKNDKGDFLLSGRFTNTIYKVSGVDGSIVWRLGGKYSSFVMNDFNFSAQHDARFRNSEFDHEEDEEMEYISFMNNAAGGAITSANHSSGFIVALDTATMTADLVNEFPRPDKSLSYLRGNVQVLPNGNVLTGWSENSYATEWSVDGSIVLETNFTSNRFVTYRTYKFNFTSTPSEDPVLKAFVYGESRGTSTSVYHVSWNGATEVKSWRFLAEAAEADISMVCTAAWQGFETTCMVSGCWDGIFAEAIGADGAVLGRSAVEAPMLPVAWSKSEEDSKTSLVVLPHSMTWPGGHDDDQTEDQVSSPSLGRYLEKHVWSIRDDTRVAVACILLLLLVLLTINISRARSTRVWHFLAWPVSRWRRMRSYYLVKDQESDGYRDESPGALLQR